MVLLTVKSTFLRVEKAHRTKEKAFLKSGKDFLSLEESFLTLEKANRAIGRTFLRVEKQKPDEVRAFHGHDLSRPLREKIKTPP